MANWKVAVFVAMAIWSYSWRLTHGLQAAQASSWTRQGHLADKAISAQQGLVSARSTLHCLAQCGKFWNCVTAAYASATKQCYMNPTWDIHTVVPVTRRVYTHNAPTCSLNSLPTVKNAAIVSASLKQDLTSYELDVRCAADYRRVNTDVVPVRCLATGEWVSKTADVCKRRIYQDEGTPWGPSFPIPGTIQKGWSANFVAMPTKETRFIFNFVDNSGNVLMHFNPRLMYGNDIKLTAINAKVNSKWMKEKVVRHPSPSFPFTPGRSYHITFTATGQSELTVSVDGAPYTTWTTPLPVADITTINVKYDVSVTFADLFDTASKG